MQVRRRTNFLWGLVLLAAAVVLLLRALDVIPEGIFDIIARAWPALIIFAGISIFLRERVPYGGLFALVLSLVLVAGVTVLAFNTRSGQQRDDYREAIAETVNPAVTLLRVRVGVLSTGVELLRSLESGRITGTFTGSSASQLQVDYVEADDNTATLTITESQREPFPLLETLGRGVFQLELPADVALDVVFTGESGETVMNMDGLALERLNIDLQQGDVVVTLPAYNPLGSAEDAMLGTLAARDGTLTLRIPEAVAAHLEVVRPGSGIPPSVDDIRYLRLEGGVLETRNFDTFDMRVRYLLDVPHGPIVVTTAGG
ncbi:MAG: hypothetical protein H6671_15120 [Anaerolineaceae bacterium]|nr:hypothetical protein [Anaerolineaceae bacterium]